MSYKLSFVTRKIYNDDIEKIKIKNGYMPNTEKLQRAKRLKKLEKQRELEELNKKFSGQLSFESLEEEQKAREKFERKHAPKLENAVRAMRRSKDNLMDILRSNNFNFFVTFTFDDKKVNNSRDDSETRICFRKWRRYVKDKFPNMTYVAIEEYQDKYGRGVLHYHILIGNITAEELGLINSGKKVRKGKTKGQIIYNVTKWKYGFSQVTEILESEACKWYVAKYLTKQKVDPRFYGKKRYFCSQNIKRPYIEKFTFPCNENADIFDSIMKDDYTIEYEDDKKEYTILSRQLPKK